MAAGDLGAVSRIAAEVHPSLPEDDAVFAERLFLYPAGCLMLGTGGEGLGYAVSHPWTGTRPPALNSLIGALPQPAPLYYIHDLALRPAARGTGAGAAGAKMLIGHAAARGFAAVALVAVGESRPFWERLGFRPAPDAPDLCGYGPGAAALVRHLFGSEPGQPFR